MSTKRIMKDLELFSESLHSHMVNSVYLIQFLIDLLLKIHIGRMKRSVEPKESGSSNPISEPKSKRNRSDNWVLEEGSPAISTEKKQIT